MKKLLFVCLLFMFCIISCKNQKYKYAITEVHPNDTNVVYYTNDIIYGEMNCIVFKILNVDSNYYYYYGNLKEDTTGMCSDYLITILK